jgi:hypothetical protein
MRRWIPSPFRSLKNRIIHSISALKATERPLLYPNARQAEIEKGLEKFESLLNAAEGRLSAQIENVRVFASRLEPIDGRSARTEAHLVEATTMLAREIEKVRILASRLEPIDGRSSRTEAHLVEATAMLAREIEKVRILASRLEPIDERSSRTEIQVLSATEALRLLVNRVEPGDVHWARFERTLGSLELLRRDLSRMDLNADDKARDILELLFHPRKPAVIRLSLKAARGVAEDSPDHTSPRGTARDNTRHPRLVGKCEALFGTVKHLDLGCGGGGLVWDFTLRGHVSAGLEGSDFNKKERRAEWRTIPDRLFTADLRYPFRFVDESGNPFDFNVITAWEVLEHIPERDIDQVIANVRDSLAFDGVFLCSIATFADKDEETGVVWHQTVKQRTWWIDRFAQHHLLEVVDLFETGDFARGIGNPRADDWDVRKNPEKGFHLVLRHFDENGRRVSAM